MGALAALEPEAPPGGRSPSCRTHPSSPARSQRSNDRSQPYVHIAGMRCFGCLPVLMQSCWGIAMPVNQHHVPGCHQAGCSLLILACYAPSG